MIQGLFSFLFSRSRKTVFGIVILLLFMSFTASAETQYEYDELHRLTKVTYDDGTTITYTYDALGNRVTKEVSSAAVTPAINFVWGKKVKAYNIVISPAEVGTRFSPGTNLKFKIKFTVDGDPAKLYKVKLNLGKIILLYLPTSDPNRIIKLKNPAGKNFDVEKNIVPGEARIVKLVGQLPPDAVPGEQFKFKGKIKLYEMGDTTVLDEHIVSRTFNIVQ